MPRLRLLNYVITTVFVLEDDDGQFVGRQAVEPREIWSEAEAVALFDEAKRFIAEQNEKLQAEANGAAVREQIVRVDT